MSDTPSSALPSGLPQPSTQPPAYDPLHEPTDYPELSSTVRPISWVTMANPRPIVSPSATPRGGPNELPSQGAAPDSGEATGVIASSLDILFSYSRSRLFYGENLPSSPSFLRYRPEGEEDTGEYYDTDDGEDENEDDYDESRIERDSIAWSEADGPRTPDARNSDGEVDEDDSERRRTSFGGAGSASRDGSVRGGPGGGPSPGGMSEDLLTPMPGRPSGGGVASSRPDWNRQSSYGFATPSGSLRNASMPLRPTSPRSPHATDDSEPNATSSSLLSPSAAAGGAHPSILSPEGAMNSPSRATPHFAPSLSPNASKFDERTPLVNNSTDSPRRASGFSHRSLDSRHSRTILNGKSRKGSVSTLRSKVRSGAGFEPGTSTYGQTLFNTVAVLVGVGLLSESLAFYYAGWGMGTVLLVYFALLTNYTAKQLAAIVRSDPSLKSYSDIARKAFGAKGIAVSNFLFCMELFSLSVAFVVLFGDTLHAVLGHFSSNQYKLLCFVIVLPTIFLPLRLLSFASLLGVLSTLVLLTSIVTDALMKKEAPGSLWHPMPTSFGPQWDKLPLVFGLLMAGFAGHAVVPSLARDMAEPERFDQMINVAYVITTCVYGFSGALGYLMFGDTILDEITKNLIVTPGFPPLLNKIALWMIVLSPVTKFALCTRPLNLTLETLLGLDIPHVVLRRNSMSSLSDGRPVALVPPGMQWKRIGIVAERTGLAMFCVLVASLIPDFSRVMAFLGSFSAFLICVIIPVLAHSALLKKSQTAIVRDRVIFIISVIMMIVGTVCAFTQGDDDAGESNPL